MKARGHLPRPSFQVTKASSSDLLEEIQPQGPLSAESGVCGGSDTAAYRRPLHETSRRETLHIRNPGTARILEEAKRPPRERIPRRIVSRACGCVFSELRFFCHRGPYRSVRLPLGANDTYMGVREVRPVGIDITAARLSPFQTNRHQ